MKNILETRALFIFGKLRYFDYGHIQMVPGPNGIPTVTVNAVQHETPEGTYLLIVSPVKDINVATNELESNQRICTAAGCLELLQGRNLVFERLYDYQARANGEEFHPGPAIEIPDSLIHLTYKSKLDFV